MGVLVVVPLTAGVILGANQTRAGAFMPWALSIVYWSTISLATWWLFAVATTLVRAVLRPWHAPEPLGWVLGAIAGSFLARPAIYAIADLFRPAMDSPNLRPMVAARLDAQFLSYYLVNWSVLIGLWVLACWWRSRLPAQPLVPEIARSAEPSLGAPGSAPTYHGVLRRLPPAIGRDVIALQAEDHYVRVHTRVGKALVLASLSDAIDDVTASGIVGQRTHRSWWVANEAVVGREQRGRQLSLLLLNGVEAPVSLTYRELAASSGLLRAMAPLDGLGSGTSAI